MNKYQIANSISNDSLNDIQIKVKDTPELSEKNDNKNKQISNNNSNVFLSESSKITSKNKSERNSLEMADKNLLHGNTKILEKIKNITINNDSKFNEINTTLTKFSEKIKEIDNSLLNFNKTVNNFELD